jgi:hypothetical protein
VPSGRSWIDFELSRIKQEYDEEDVANAPQTIHDHLGYPH